MPRCLIAIALSLFALPAFAAEPPAAPCDPAKSARSCAKSDQIVEIEAHRRSGVVSAWLANGLRIHHKLIEQPPGQVLVTISMSGGELLETEANRGVTVAASGCFDYPAARSMDHARIEESLAGRDIHIDGSATPDALVLRIWGSAADLPHGMKTAALLLSEPLATAEALDAIKAQALREIQDRPRSERGLVSECLMDAIFPPGDPRSRLLDAPQIERQTVDTAQHWLDRHVQRSATEVSIVGDVPLEETLRLASAFLGPLPERSRIGKRTCEEQRRVERPPGPIHCEFERDTGGAAIVVFGFFGADVCQTRDHRTLRVAAKILAEQINARLAADLPAIGSPAAATSIPSGVYPGFGLVLAQASVPPEHAAAVLDLMRSVTADLGTTPPNPDQIARAAEESARMVEAFDREPRYWGGMLARSTARSICPEAAAGGAAFYRSLKPDDVSAAVQRFATPDAQISILIRPSPAPDQTARLAR